MLLLINTRQHNTFMFLTVWSSLKSESLGIGSWSSTESWTWASTWASTKSWTCTNSNTWSWFRLKIRISFWISDQKFHEKWMKIIIDITVVAIIALHHCSEAYGWWISLINDIHVFFNKNDSLLKKRNIYKNENNISEITEKCQSYSNENLSKNMK